MESKNMWKINYAPPLLRGLWKLGVEIPPLPFASFWQISVMMIWFGPVWGNVMWFSSWKRMGMSPSVAIFWSLIAGILFTVLMGAFHWWCKKANNLPEWKDL